MSDIHELDRSMSKTRQCAFCRPPDHLLSRYFHFSQELEDVCTEHDLKLLPEVAMVINMGHVFSKVGFSYAVFVLDITVLERRTIRRILLLRCRTLCLFPSRISTCFVLVRLL